MTLLLAITGSVHGAIHKVLPFRKMAPHKRREFSVDLALIALAVRIGFLVDTIAVKDPATVYADLLRDLREENPIFGDVLHLLDPASEQSFFVNTRRLAGLSRPDPISFIILRQDGTDPQLLAAPPPNVLRVVQDLVSAVACESSSTTKNITLALPPSLPPSTVIPLAAVLLGYLVAYVPAPTGGGDSAFLADTPLHVYTCLLRASGLPEHTLLKFSCPASLAESTPHLTPAHLVEQLTACFGPHASELGLTLVVHHSLETLDRVAL